MPGLYLQGEHVLLETVSVQHLEERRILKRTVNDCSDFIPPLYGFVLPGRGGWGRRFSD